jgi:hypothetical protein
MLLWSAVAGTLQVWSAVAGTLKVLLTVAGTLKMRSAVAGIASVVDFCLLFHGLFLLLLDLCLMTLRV